MDFVYLALIALFFAAVVGLAYGCVASQGSQMSGLYIISGVIAAGLLVYLVAALLFPEDFS